MLHCFTAAAPEVLDPALADCDRRQLTGDDSNLGPVGGVPPGSYPSVSRLL